MLKDCLEVFNKKIEKSGDKLILDNYIPDDGTYIIVDLENNNVISQDIKYDKKNKTLNKGSISYYEDICNYDYYSVLLEMNKPIDPKKKIMSNNYMTFFTKKSSVKPEVLTDEIIDTYYKILADPEIKYEGKAKSKAIYKEVEKHLGKVNIEELNKCKSWIKENLFKLDIDTEKKDYLKIFFKYPIEAYVREGSRYFTPNIYNKNDFNIVINNKTFGMHNNNNGLNAKKPFFENKTRKNKIAYLIDDSEVLLQKKLFDYFSNLVNQSKYNVYINNEEISAYSEAKFPDYDFSGIYLRMRKDKNEVAIISCDYITDYSNKLKKEFIFENVLDSDISKDTEIKYGKYKCLSDIEKLINIIIFSKWLHNNYFTEPDKISMNDGYLKSSLIIAREVLGNWFYKGDSSGVCAVLNKVTLNIIKGNISDGNIPKARTQFNFRWSIKKYFGGDINMADVLNSIKSELRTKINAENTGKINNDNEYYFAVGQLVYYFISKNKGNKKPHSLANPFVNAKNNEVIKEKLRALYKKYNYDIDIKGRRFKNLYAMILSYEPEGKINQDIIIAGYLHDNLIYEKDKKED